MPYTNHVPTFKAQVYEIMDRPNICPEAFNELYPEFEPMSQDKLYAVAAIMDENDFNGFKMNSADCTVSSALDKESQKKYVRYNAIIPLYGKGKSAYIETGIHYGTTFFDVITVEALGVISKNAINRAYFKKDLIASEAIGDFGEDMSWVTESLIAMLNNALKRYCTAALYQIYLKRGVSGHDRAVPPFGNVML